MIFNWALSPFDILIGLAFGVAAFALWVWFRRLSNDLRYADEQVRARNVELEVLNQVSLSITSSLELMRVFDTILHSAFRFAPGAENAHIFLYAENRLTFGAALWSDGHTGEPVAEPRSNGLTATVARRGKTLVVPDMRRHPLFGDTHREWQGAIVGIPLRAGGGVVGVMNVAYSEPHNFSENEMRALQLLADQAAIAIANARLHEQVQDSETRHRTLVENISVGIYRVTPGAQGKFLMANPAYLTTLGYESFEELQQIHVSDIYPNPADRIKFSDLIIQAGRIENYEQQIKRKDGALIWVLVTAQTIYQNETPEYFDCTLIDITARKRAVAELGILHRIAEVANRATDAEHLLEHVSRELAASLAPDALFIGLFDAATNELDFRVHIDAGKHEPPERRPLHEMPITASVVASKKPLLITDWEKQRETFPPPFLFGTMKLPRTWLGVPMLLRDQVMGVISIQSYQPNAYSKQEEQLLGTIADQVVIAIERARSFAAERAAVEKAKALLNETQQRALEQSALSEIAQALNATLDVQRAFPKIAKSLGDIVQFDRASLVLLDGPSRDSFTTVALDNSSEVLSPSTQMPVAASAAMSDILAGRIHLAPDLHLETNYATEKILYGAGFRSRINIPLMLGERSMGALNLVRRQVSDWHDVNLPLFQQIASTLAIALENSELWSRLREQARRDSLTQVLSHGTLIADLQITFAHCSPRNEPLSFIMLDIDNFKRYNDTYGHVVGDLVLTKITRALQDQLRPGDFVGRWGGEEFSVVLPNTAQDAALQMGERIRSALADISLHDRRDRTLPSPTVSQGVASIPESALTVEDLIEQADRAVYRAKSLGKNKLVAAEKSTPRKSKPTA